MVGRGASSVIGYAAASPEDTLDCSIEACVLSGKIWCRSMAPAGQAAERAATALARRRHRRPVTVSAAT